MLPFIALTRRHKIFLFLFFWRGKKKAQSPKPKVHPSLFFFLAMPLGPARPHPPRVLGFPKCRLRFWEVIYILQWWDVLATRGVIGHIAGLLIESCHWPFDLICNLDFNRIMLLAFFIWSALRFSLELDACIRQHMDSSFFFPMTRNSGLWYNDTATLRLIDDASMALDLLAMTW